MADEARVRLRALELETATEVSTDFAGRARMNSSSTICREFPSWVWVIMEDAAQTQANNIAVIAKTKRVIMMLSILVSATPQH
jgi:hypothetical protein